MSEINPPSSGDQPPILGPGGTRKPPPMPPTNPEDQPSGHFEAGSGFQGFKKWLGKHNYKMFISNVCRAISSDIGKQKKKAKEASDRLKASTEGKDYP